MYIHISIGRQIEKAAFTVILSEFLSLSSEIIEMRDDKLIRLDAAIPSKFLDEDFK